uniref:ATP-binding cassette domain-containing protein n=1 Tax=Roseibium sp. TaxID=1936156 RepID=UPI003D09C546
MPLLEINQLTHYFGGLRAVGDFNLRLEPGELVGLIGPNGAGKTTVFNLVTGAYRASEGSINFEGQELVGKTPHVINGLGIARTFQTIRLWNEMTVLDNIKVAHHGRLSYWLAEIFLQSQRMRREEEEIEAHAVELLRLFKLERYAYEPAKNL